jgi:hypothetical protein
MASAKNRRTSPFIMGNKTMAPPQPINKTMSGAQRVSQIQGKQMPPSGRSTMRSAGPPAPLPTRGNNSQARQSVPRVDSSNAEGVSRRELSIPEAFAMLNRKIAMMEEVLEEKGYEFENHTMIDRNPGVDVDEKLAMLRRDVEDAVNASSPNTNNILKQIQMIKEEKDSEIAELNNTIHELSEELREFKNRFEHDVLSTSALEDDESATLISYNDNSNERECSLDELDNSVKENVSMVINEHGDMDYNKPENSDSRENEESIADVMEEVVEEVVEQVESGEGEANDLSL